MVEVSDLARTREEFWGHIEARGPLAEQALDALIAAEVVAAIQTATADLHAQIRTQRQATARAWSAFLDLALHDRLEDGTLVLDVVFAHNPDLRSRLAALLDQPQGAVS